MKFKTKRGIRVTYKVTMQHLNNGPIFTNETSNYNDIFNFNSKLANILFVTKIRSPYKQQIAAY